MSKLVQLALGLTLALCTATGAVLWQTVILSREINVKLEAISKTQDRMLNRLEDIEKHVDWTGRG